MAKQEYLELPGNSIMSQAAMDRFVYNNGRAVLSIEHYAYTSFREGARMKALRFKCPDGPHGEWLCVATAQIDGVDLVCFTSGASFDDVLRNVGNRLANGSMKWKDDEYA